MCLYVIMRANIPVIVYGAKYREGALGTRINLPEAMEWHKKIEIIPGILEDYCQRAKISNYERIYIDKNSAILFCPN